MYHVYMHSISFFLHCSLLERTRWILLKRLLGGSSAFHRPWNSGIFSLQEYVQFSWRYYRMQPEGPTNDINIARRTTRRTINIPPAMDLRHFQEYIRPVGLVLAHVVAESSKSHAVSSTGEQPKYPNLHQTLRHQIRKCKCIQYQLSRIENACMPW